MWRRPLKWEEIAPFVFAEERAKAEMDDAERQYMVDRTPAAYECWGSAISRFETAHSEATTARRIDGIVGVKIIKPWH